MSRRLPLAGPWTNGVVAAPAPLIELDVAPRTRAQVDEPQHHHDP